MAAATARAAVVLPPDGLAGVRWPWSGRAAGRRPQNSPLTPSSCSVPSAAGAASIRSGRSPGDGDPEPYLDPAHLLPDAPVATDRV